MVQGQGAKTNFQINGKAPGGKSSVLLFQIKADHLQDCNSKLNKNLVVYSYFFSVN